MQSCGSGSHKKQEYEYLNRLLWHTGDNVRGNKNLLFILAVRLDLFPPEITQNTKTKQKLQQIRNW